jgi:hypothetical protein
MCSATNTHQLTLRAFTAIKREGQNDFWLTIGAAFVHERGDGFNSILRTLPFSNGDGIVRGLSVTHEHRARRAFGPSLCVWTDLWILVFLHPYLPYPHPVTIGAAKNLS